jgi:hypothetical protein
LIIRTMSPEQPTGSDQKLLLGDLCIFANLAINLPETVSTFAASQAIAVWAPPPTRVVGGTIRGGLRLHLPSIPASAVMTG